MRKKQLVLLGALGIGGYLLWRQSQAAAAPAVVTAPATAIPQAHVAGFGRFGWGAPLPFPRAYPRAVRY